MTEHKKNRIPTVSLERLNTLPSDAAVKNTKEDRAAYAFLKGKELTQPITIRIPTSIYQSLRRIAFDKNEKINQIVVRLVKQYIGE